MLEQIQEGATDYEKQALASLQNAPKSEFYAD